MWSPFTGSYYLTKDQVGHKFARDVTWEEKEGQIQWLKLFERATKRPSDGSPDNQTQMRPTRVTSVYPVRFIRGVAAGTKMENLKLDTPLK